MGSMFDSTTILSNDETSSAPERWARKLPGSSRRETNVANLLWFPSGTTSQRMAWWMPQEIPQTSVLPSAADINALILEGLWLLYLRRIISDRQYEEFVTRIAVQTSSPELFIIAIKLMIAEGYAAMARRIAHQGKRTFPHASELATLNRILSPNRVVRHAASAPADQALNMQWLSRSADQFLGQWVALRGGVLLAAADSRAALVDMLDHDIPLREVLITRVV